MARKALVVWGGWEGHQPQQVGALLASLLRDNGFTVEVFDTLDAFRDLQKLMDLDLIVPVWTMGRISHEQLDPVLKAVQGGVGIGGCHGGMCDAFREATDWQFMTGGQWVAHPGNDGVEYTVRITDPDHPITRGLSDFTVRSEQYYMHVDPANTVLAVTRFPAPGVGGPHTANGPVDMPVVWTKMYGNGKVFYCSLGHTVSVLEQPEVKEIMRRGLLWAART